MSAVATPTTSPEVLARKNGSCPECSEPIVAGESYVAKVDGCKKGWMHATCADAYVRDRERADAIFAEHQETDDASGVREES